MRWATTSGRRTPPAAMDTSPSPASPRIWPPGSSTCSREHRQNPSREAREGVVAKTQKTKPVARVRPARPVKVEPRPTPPATAGAPPPESRGKYVYCIIRATRPLQFGSIGIGAEPAAVQTVNHEGIAAVFSDTPVESFDATRENVLAHERVNEAVMRQHTVIPMSFGTVFKTRDDIVELLRGAHAAFSDVLFKMEDKLEFGLKVLWERDVIIQEIEREDEDIQRLKKEISSQKGSTYFARMAAWPASSSSCAAYRWPPAPTSPSATR